MNWENAIKQQIGAHRRLNLFSGKHQGSFEFSETTKKLMDQIAAGQFSWQEEKNLLQFTVDTVLSSLYNINQYYQFRKEDRSDLILIYQRLLNDIKQSKYKSVDHNKLAEAHFIRLQTWLAEKQPESIHLYPSTQAVIDPVVCCEYSLAIQLQTLYINEAVLKEPVLDIGCGKEHHLVNYLQQKGYKVFGIDREVRPAQTIFNASWLEFDYGASNWGTIISHLGFTNHFRHHHLKVNGDYLQYANTFLRILHALKISGSFYYAPDLPFIEAFLNPLQFSVTKNPITGTPFYSSCIKRLS